MHLYPWLYCASDASCTNTIEAAGPSPTEKMLDTTSEDLK
jgi:hypothetical protein